MESKSILQSKTFWANILGVIAAMFGADGSLGHVFKPEEIALGFGVLNLGLRFVTEKKIVF